eukprot:838946-Rhodomonas_salina.1
MMMILHWQPRFQQLSTLDPKSCLSRLPPTSSPTWGAARLLLPPGSRPVACSEAPTPKSVSNPRHRYTMNSLVTLAQLAMPNHQSESQTPLNHDTAPADRSPSTQTRTCKTLRKSPRRGTEAYGSPSQPSW